MDDDIDVDALIDEDVGYDDVVDDYYNAPINDANDDVEGTGTIGTGTGTPRGAAGHDEDEGMMFPDDDDEDEKGDGVHGTRRMGVGVGATMMKEGLEQHDADGENDGGRGLNALDDDTASTRAQKRSKSTHGDGDDNIISGSGFDFETAAKETAMRLARGAMAELTSNARDNAPVKDAADIDGDVQAITLNDGTRIYVKKEAFDVPLVPMDVVLRRATSGEPLLSRSIDDMLDAYEKERYQRALEAAQAVENGENVENLDSDTVMTDVERTRGEIMADGVRKKLAGMLWAERHAPKSFVDLLSPEQTNREVLHWLKGWDKVVFNKDPPPATMKKFYSDRYAEKTGYKGKRHEHNETHVALDALKRPKEKILLLSGPPGSGKTTLAHVVAKHCGYQPIEINASDDRSASTLKVKLADALYTQSVFGKKKPTCVILDEIDGSHNGGDGKGAVWMLLNMTKDSKFRAPLMRPVIAICNDLYATALKPLRNVAKVFRMKQPPTNQITARVRDVCVKEKVDAEPRAIALIVDRVDHDIRAALNAVQLIAKTSSKVTLRDVVFSRGGEKDSKSPAWTMWQDLLRGRHTFPRARIEGGARKTHLDKMRDRLETFGDNDSVFDGLFENLPHVGFQDGTMYRMMNAIDSVLDGAMFQYKSFATGENSLRNYATECALAVHSCATHAGVLTDAMQWPKTGRAIKEKNSRMDVLNSRRDAVDLSIRHVSIDRDVMETLPFLNTLIAPELRSVAATFMTEDEKQTLKSTVVLMREQGLNYKPAATKYGEQSWRAGACALVLEPPIDDFTKFGGGVEALRPDERLTWKERREREREHAESPSSTAVKHTVLVHRRPVNNSLRTIIANELVTDAERRSGAASAQASANAKLQRAEQKARVALGVQGGNKHRLANAAKSNPAQHTMQFKYNEGYTTGVRRTVLMRDLFPQLAPSSNAAH